jgi:maleylpyruvate isomerase
MLKDLTLHAYWRSSASWRVRAALHYKGLSFKTIPVHLIQQGGQQNTAEYEALNPMKQIPLLSFEDDGGRVIRIAQSLAIIEFLDEVMPLPSLLPSDPVERAVVRQLSELVNSGIQPLQNTSVLLKLKADYGASDPNPWCQHWIEKGLKAYQASLKGIHGRFSVGDSVTMADLCLVPQVYNARRFGVPLGELGLLVDIEAACNELPAFQAAHPAAQIDTPDEERAKP